MRWSALGLAASTAGVTIGNEGWSVTRKSNAAFDVTPAAALIEVNAFGFPPFTGGNATDPGSQPARF